jgi:A/G-specific adenine glycosylase
MTSEVSGFARRVIAWQAQFGRNDLPWQGSTDPYRIWVSEIMLQQTQVASVIDRYAAFLARFPDVGALAAASLDEVLGCWSGLGYYSRARNLHACAQAIVTDHGGRFPLEVKALSDLPGIGRSTAAAIAAFAEGEAAPILDGNVKRVLARVFAVDGWTASAAVERRLWSLAESLLPQEGGAQGLRRYTQGLMDLGATVCTPRRPVCSACPVSEQCEALAQDRVDQLPSPRPTRVVPRKQADWALIVHAGRVLLEVRAQRGIWGGLWSLPEIRPPGAESLSPLDAEQVKGWWGNHPDLGELGLSAVPTKLPHTVRHVFTHFKLEAQVWELVMDPPGDGQWAPRMRWLPLQTEAIAQAPLAMPVRVVLLARAAREQSEQSAPYRGLGGG